MDPQDFALATDLYELTMAAAYFDNKQSTINATFELFVRDYPKNRSYLVAAGLQQAVEYLMQMYFTDTQITFLKEHPTFASVSDDFFDYLKEFKFSGDLWAMPEGTIFFPNEPILRITAPIIEAQVVETYLLSLINFETLIATKSSRIVQSARGRGVVEFGARRAHGPESALLAARASYIGGCIGTSNVLAAFKFGIPMYGTMAHSFIMSYDKEEEAFRSFCRVFPKNPALLLDTYDTIVAARTAVALGVKPSLVRLDSGNRSVLSRKVRRILDDAGMQDTKIFVSGDLNEYVIDRLTAQGQPIDYFGVGTELVTSRDDPALSAIYKLVSINRGRNTIFRVKTSTGKQTVPGAKQVYRRMTKHGLLRKDIIALADEIPPKNARPLLMNVIVGGRLRETLPSLEQVRETAENEMKTLPKKFRRLRGSAKPPVSLSPRLKRLTTTMWKTVR
jgi:nicotinate phosphoribosyltransferase